MAYIKVTNGKDGEVMEVPVEEDGTLLLSSLEAQFGAVSGLKYQSEESGAMRGVRTRDGVLFPPEEGSWGSRVYVAVAKPAAPAPSENDRDRERERDRERDRVDGKSSSDDGPSSKRSADDGDDDGSKRKRQSCYRCGGQGHIQEMCPSPEGARQAGGAECHLCHGFGHIKARCPNSIPRGVCYRCGMYGHNGRECRSYSQQQQQYSAPSQGQYSAYGYATEDPYAAYSRAYSQGSSQQGSSGSRPSYGERLCYRCHQPGHQAHSCPRQGQPGEPSATACYKCGLDGHFARACDVCYTCKQRGHRAADCPDRGSQAGGQSQASQQQRQL